MSHGDQPLIGWQGGGQGGWISEVRPVRPVRPVSQDATLTLILIQLPSLTLLDYFLQYKRNALKIFIL